MDLAYLKTLTLLYIEDDASTIESYLPILQLLFAKITIAQNYDEAMRCYNDTTPHLILVDISLGGLSGMEIVKEIRSDNFAIPIVFLTGHSDTNYLLEATNLHIDGYIIKPLTLNKLEKAMNNCLRRIASEAKVYLDSNTHYDINTTKLIHNSVEIHLGKKEAQLLSLFVKHRDRVFSKEEIEFAIWNDTSVSDTTIKSLIASLRKKIGKDRVVNINRIGWKIHIE